MSLWLLSGTWVEAAEHDYQDSKLSVPLLCDDFERQKDGTWLPQRPFTIEGVDRGTKFRSTHGINTVIRKGVPIEGIDLGAQLEEQCMKS